MAGLRPLFLVLLLAGFTAPSSGEIAENDVIFRKDFEQMKNLVKILNERVQIQDQRLSDLENEVKALKSEVKQKNEFIEKMTEPYTASLSENNAQQKSFIVKKRSGVENSNDKKQGKCEYNICICNSVIYY